MGMFEILSLLSCKNGDELFETVKELLGRAKISVYNEDGSVKDVQTVIYEVAAVINRASERKKEL